MKKNILLVLMLITIVLLTGCSKKQNKEEETKKIENVGNVSYKEVFRSSDEILLELTNENSFTVDTELFIYYLTKDGLEADLDYDYIDCLGSNETGYIGLDLPDEEFASYKIEITAKTSELKNNKDKIETKLTEKKTMEVTITNTSDKSIDNISYYVVFMKKGKIVGYDQSFGFGLEANDSKKSTIYPSYEGIEKNKYDEAIVKINEAYTK